MTGAGDSNGPDTSGGLLSGLHGFWNAVFLGWMDEEGQVSNLLRRVTRGERTPVWPEGSGPGDAGEDCTALIPTRTSSLARTSGAGVPGVELEAAYRTLGVRWTISDRELKLHLRRIVNRLREQRPEGWEQRRRNLVDAYKTVMQKRRTWREDRTRGMVDSRMQISRLGEREAEFPVRGLWFIQWVQELNLAFAVDRRVQFPNTKVQNRGRACPLCKGFGVYYSQLHVGFIDCRLCRGTGEKPSQPADPQNPSCESCHGWNEIFNGYLGRWRECSECTAD